MNQRGGPDQIHVGVIAPEAGQCHKTCTIQGLSVGVGNRGVRSSGQLLDHVLHSAFKLCIGQFSILCFIQEQLGSIVVVPCRRVGLQKGWCQGFGQNVRMYARGRDDMQVATPLHGMGSAIEAGQAVALHQLECVTGFIVIGVVHEYRRIDGAKAAGTGRDHAIVIFLYHDH
jgi:hypothetical protein